MFGSYSVSVILLLLVGCVEYIKALQNVLCYCENLVTTDWSDFKFDYCTHAIYTSVKIDSSGIIMDMSFENISM